MDLDAVAAEIAAWEREGMRLVTLLDDDYPLCLRLVHQRPPILFLRGTPAEGGLRVAWRPVVEFGSLSLDLRRSGKRSAAGSRKSIRSMRAVWRRTSRG
ncbi:hypothetical protein [Streptomyces sp. NPDC058755]|uniref:hypothetical protein n=1 Tax=Streptomyces sp. NPDC058755 TaxID=3346624 RepID=UPI003678F567